jgi:CheY-like chemotaxis protein
MDSLTATSTRTLRLQHTRTHARTHAQGLQLLVVESDAAAASEAQSQLAACGYAPTVVGSAAEAEERLAEPGGDRFELLLVDVDALDAPTSSDSASSPGNGNGSSPLLAAAESRGLSLVLMGASARACPSMIIAGIQRGAADFLEKPLSHSKLRNIWQHVVRRMMVPRAGGGGADYLAPAGRSVGSSRLRLTPGSLLTSAPTILCGPASGSSLAAVSGGGCGLEDDDDTLFDFDDHMSTGIDHMSTGMMMDAGTSLLIDHMEDVLGDPLSGLAMSMLADDDGDVPDDDGGLFGLVSVAVRKAGLRSGAAKPAPQAAGAGAGALGSPKAPAPAMGYPCGGGVLPELTSAGMAWGLPTNPLHITPMMAPLPQLPGMPWMAPPTPGPVLWPGQGPVPPWMTPPVPGGKPPPLMPPPPYAMMAAMMNAQAAPHMPLHAPHMPPLAAALCPNKPAPAPPAAAQARGPPPPPPALSARRTVKRCESVPAKLRLQAQHQQQQHLRSGGHSSSSLAAGSFRRTVSDLDAPAPTMMACAPAACATTTTTTTAAIAELDEHADLCELLAQELLGDTAGGRGGWAPSPPPIGLTLHKSQSLLDMINGSLMAGGEPLAVL